MTSEQAGVNGRAHCPQNRRRISGQFSREQFPLWFCKAPKHCGEEKRRRLSWLGLEEKLDRQFRMYMHAYICRMELALSSER